MILNSFTKRPSRLLFGRGRVMEETQTCLFKWHFKCFRKKMVAFNFLTVVATITVAVRCFTAVWKYRRSIANFFTSLQSFCMRNEGRVRKARPPVNGPILHSMFELPRGISVTRSRHESRVNFQRELTKELIIGEPRILSLVDNRDSCSRTRRPQMRANVNAGKCVARERHKKGKALRPLSK